MVQIGMSHDHVSISWVMLTWSVMSCKYIHIYIYMYLGQQMQPLVMLQLIEFFTWRMRRRKRSCLHLRLERVGSDVVGNKGSGLSGSTVTAW